MESFIVRIYRRDEGEIAGLVEVVEDGKRASFTSIDELMAILKPREKEDVK